MKKEIEIGKKVEILPKGTQGRVVGIGNGEALIKKKADVRRRFKRVKLENLRKVEQSTNYIKH